MSKVVKVALLLDGAAKDGDWNQVAANGMKEAESKFGARIKVTVEQSVPFSSQAASLVSGLIGEGYSLFFVDTSGYENYLAPVAAAHPSIRIEEADSAVRKANFGGYYIAYADPEYLAGMILEGAAKNGKVGMVAGFPFPAYFNQINGVALGAQRVNPHAVSQVDYTGSFYDPSKEQQATRALIAGGAKAIAGIIDDPSVCETAQSENVPCMTEDLINGPHYAPKTYLGSFMMESGWAFKTVIGDVLASRTVPNFLFGGISSGAGGIEYFGPAYSKYVSAKVRAMVAEATKQLKSGKFQVFTGPIKDQKGQMKVPAGKSMTPNQIITQSWLVKGVIGKT